jgi:hypothetical protein
MLGRLRSKFSNVRIFGASTAETGSIPSETGSVRGDQSSSAMRLKADIYVAVIRPGPYLFKGPCLVTEAGIAERKCLNLSRCSWRKLFNKTPDARNFILCRPFPTEIRQFLSTGLMCRFELDESYRECWLAR